MNGDENRGALRPVLFVSPALLFARRPPGAAVPVEIPADHNCSDGPQRP